VRKKLKNLQISLGSTTERKKNFMKKILSLLLMAAFMLVTIPFQAFAQDELTAEKESKSIKDSSAYTFDISINDEDGNPVDAANVSLYSYLDSKVVKNTTTEESGACTVYYMPSFDAKNLDKKSLLKGSSKELVYGDYIVYVAKDGYESALYYLTKGYTSSRKNSYDEMNSQKISITLHPVKETTMSAQSSNIMDSKAAYQKEVYDYCVETGKISDENPIYILQPEDKEELSMQGIVNPDVNQRAVSAARGVVKNYRNLLVPIGTFHVGPNAKVDVTFSSSNKLSVQTAVDGSISGSITRDLGRSIDYASFTSSTYKKQTYYTKADFVEE
jgi:hypothetical protein